MNKGRGEEGDANDGVLPLNFGVGINEETQKIIEISGNVVNDDSNDVSVVVEECHVELKHSDNVLSLLEIIERDLSASKESDFLCTEIEKDWVRQSIKVLQRSRIKDQG